MQTFCGGDTAFLYQQSPEKWQSGAPHILQPADTLKFNCIIAWWDVTYCWCCIIYWCHKAADTRKTASRVSQQAAESKAEQYQIILISPMLKTLTAHPFHSKIERRKKKSLLWTHRKPHWPPWTPAESWKGPSPTRHRQEPVCHPAVWRYSWFPQWHSQTAHPPLVDLPLYNQTDTYMYQCNCLHASKSTQRKPPVLTRHTLKQPAGETEYQGLMSYVGKQSVLPVSSRTLGYPDPVGLPLPQWSVPGPPCSPCPSSSGWRWPDLLPTDRKQVPVLWQRRGKKCLMLSCWLRFEPRGHLTFLNSSRDGKLPSTTSWFTFICKFWEKVQL